MHSKALNLLEFYGFLPMSLNTDPCNNQEDLIFLI